MLEQDQGLLVKMLEFQITSWDVQSSIELTKELNTKMCHSLSFDLLMDIMVELTLIRNWRHGRQDLPGLEDIQE